MNNILEYLPIYYEIGYISIFCDDEKLPNFQSCIFSRG